jgi:hypothetical protein
MRFLPIRFHEIKLYVLLIFHARSIHCINHTGCNRQFKKNSHINMVMQSYKFHCEIRTIYEHRNVFYKGHAVEYLVEVV